MCDWIGWIIGVIGIAYAVFTDWRTKNKLNIAHAGLVSLKPAIQGDNKEDVIKAINDLLQKLQPPKNRN